ncbi:hypothetical protein HW115_15690 [Verrucomicrobiaceae bacterium N1E253]|uniref:Uncharacterized protein n=1 Tax=Oceaniferula marina TaxID=2748318 RepID=A0A851GPL6_9BACT|nr:hypothetical protein [Oceaniferula marina]NWK57065.1 hypothetical protein [Oceaniferula marina]
MLEETELEKERRLSAPLADQKRVIAHYMTGMLYHRGMPRKSANLRSEMYDPCGPSAKVGGLVQYRSMLAAYGEGLSIDESAAMEIRAAKKLGLDGFQFFYPLGDSEDMMAYYNQVVSAFFRVVIKEEIDFKLTLCLCNPRQHEKSERDKIAHWKKWIQPLISEFGSSDAWLKTPGERFVFFTWCPDALSDAVDQHWMIGRQPELIRHSAGAYQRLAQNLGVDIAYVYHLRFQDRPEVVEAALDHFPAIWGWTDSYAEDDPWEGIAKRCRVRNRSYTQTVYPDHYGSKVYPRKKGSRMLFYLKDVLALGVDGVERKIQVCGLSEVYRKLLERAVKVDACMINYATWNDYPEGHHLAPEVNHNYAFALLLKHYKRLWLGESPEPGEFACVFFKKYAHDVKASHFHYQIKVTKALASADVEDGIEVVCYLKNPAELLVNGVSRGQVAGGLQRRKFAMERGQVRVQLRRAGVDVIDFTTPEGMTDQPYRTDRLTYAYSSEFDRLHQEVFQGRFRPLVSDEYALDSDGQANWRSRYKLQEP